MRHIPHPFLIILVLTVFGSSCTLRDDHGPGGGSATPRNSPKPDPVAVETVAVETGDIAAYLETTTNITAETEISIFPKISGQIESLNVHEGDTVKKGQILAALDDDELKLRLQQAAVARSRALEKMKRTKSLFDSQMISRENYEDAEYAFQDADVAWKLADLNLSHSRITSPINGIVTGRNVSVGDLVQLSTPLFTIVDPDSIIVDTYLPERDVMKLRIGLQASIIPGALSDKIFNARISRINPVVDPSSGTVKVTITPEDPDRELSPGMFVHVKILLEKHTNTILVPKKALLRRNSDRYVFVMDQGIADKRILETGIETAGKVEILAGLTPGEQLIIVGQNNLEPGQEVFNSRNTDSDDSGKTAAAPTTGAGATP